MRELLVLAVIGLGTYGLRGAFLVSTEPRSPRVLDRVLPYVGPAVLAAITVPMLIAPGGTVSPAVSVPALVAGAVTWLLWRHVGGLLLPLLGGFTLWWVLGALVPG